MPTLPSLHPHHRCVPKTTLHSMRTQKYNISGPSLTLRSQVIPNTENYVLLCNGAVIYLSLVFEWAGTPRLRAERLNSSVYQKQRRALGLLRVPTRAACAKPVSKQQTHHDCKRVVLRARNLKRAFLQKNTGRLRVGQVTLGRTYRVRTLGRTTTGTSKRWLGAPRVQ